MTEGFRDKERWSPILRSLALFLIGPLLLSVAWDADGDPTTDNLPQIVFAARPSEDAEVSTAATGSLHSTDTERSLLSIRSWLRRAAKLVFREYRFACLVSPARGP
jgi:hypothetical protein